jgi:hypothetical protein
MISEDGPRCEVLEEIKGMTERFYGNLFTSEPCESDAVFEAMPSKVTSDMNDELTKP